MEKPEDWIRKRAAKLDKEVAGCSVSICPESILREQNIRQAIIEFLNENMVQKDCDTCTEFTPKAPGAVTGDCPFFSGPVASTFGCKRHCRS